MYFMKINFIVFASLMLTALSARSQNSLQSNSTELQKFYEAAQSSFNSAMPSMPSFERKVGTVGSAYLFENWVPGTVIDNEGTKFSDGYLFNFNKQSQNLYIRLRDTTAAFLVNKYLVRSIYLSDGNNSYLLERIPSLDSNFFYTSLAKGNKYSLYSFTKTKFIPSDYYTNGVSSSGNMYDEFKDETIYYIISTDGTAKQIPLKKKAVKAAFEGEKDKVEEFFKNNETANNPFGENFLKSLVEYLNP